MTLVSEKSANNFFAENWQKSPKIVIVTSTPSFGPCKTMPFDQSAFDLNRLLHCSEIWKEASFITARWVNRHFTTLPCGTGLPDGWFSNQRSQFE
jgi:hypothetical protein